MGAVGVGAVEENSEVLLHGVDGVGGVPDGDEVVHGRVLAGGRVVWRLRAERNSRMRR